MTRRLRLKWDAGSAAAGPAGHRAIRLLAVSDERDATLDNPGNRDELTPLDAILGCGDLEPDYLAYLGDAFRVPLLYVRGNHDRGGAWRAGSAHLPQPLDGRVETIAGVVIAGLSWPGRAEGRAELDGAAAWWQALGAVRRSLLTGTRPRVLISHVPPRGLGDADADAFHRGFGAYHWLCRTLRPVLWLHGHTTVAAAAGWRTTWGTTTLVNVTGGVLIELAPAGNDGGR